MPQDFASAEKRFNSLPLEKQREVIHRMQFEALPIEKQREVISRMENAQKTGALEAAARGFGQGLTFNTLDEMIGTVKGGVRALGGEPLGQSVEEEIELARRGFRKAERDQPFATGAGQVAGAVLPAIAAPVIGGSKLAAGTLLGAGAKAVIPKTAAGKLGAGVAAGGLAGAGAAEEKPGTEEFRHSVKAGMAGGALGQAGFGLGKLIVGKTGKIAGGLSRAIGQAEKSGAISNLIVKTAKAKVPGPLRKGLDKTVKLMEAGNLPVEQAGILMKGAQSGGAGLAGAYMNLINNDVEFARAMEAGEIKPPPGKLGDFVPKAFTEESKSTMGGRIQAGLDDILGVDQIGLDPGEKPYAGQPTEDDRAAMALVPLFAGITKKVTSLNPEKIKELLEKKGKKLSGIDEERLRILNKPGMSEARKNKLIEKINEGISGEGSGNVRSIETPKVRYHDDTLEELTAKLDKMPRQDREFALIEGEIQRRLKGAKDGGIRTRKSIKSKSFLDKIRNKEIPNDASQVVWRDAKKSHDVPWDEPPVNGVMGKDVASGTGDMFSWGQSKHNLTKDYLKKYGDKIKSISTRNDLISHDDYAELIPKDAVVKMHIPAAYDRMGKAMEPGAPSLLRRLKAIEKLRKKGKKVEIVFDVPQENGETVIGAWRGMNFVKDFARDKGIDLKGIRTRRNHIDVTGEKAEKIKKMIGEEYFEKSKPMTASDMLKQIDEDLKSGKIKNIKKDKD